MSHVAAVSVQRSLLRLIAELCVRLKVDGHRGEITIARAARSLAAFEGRKHVTSEDVRRVARMSLAHRLRRDPLEQTGGGAQIEQATEELFGTNQDSTQPDPDSASTDTRQRKPKKSPPDEPGGSGNGGGQPRREDARRKTSERREERPAPSQEQPRTPAGAERPAPPLDARLPSNSFDERVRVKKSNARSTSRGTRQAGARAKASRARGRYARAVAVRTDDLKIALDATVRAAAASQMLRRGMSRESALQVANEGRALGVETTDFRYKRFSRRAGTLYIFAVDTSGSMALNRIAQAKGALARLLRQSYLNRDRVALITFREREGRVLLAPSQSSALAKRLLDALPVGGATPLTAGLLRALEVSERAARQGTDRIVLLVFTDGRANVTRDGVAGGDLRDVRRRIKGEVEKIGAALKRRGVAPVIVDTQNRFTSGGEGQALAHTLGGQYVHLAS
jgi:magnesium chelatase subunit D